MFLVGGLLILFVACILYGAMSVGISLGRTGSTPGNLAITIATLIIGVLGICIMVGYLMVQANFAG